jgi:hypothetical protein
MCSNPQNVAAEQASEKVGYFVIACPVRDLLLHKWQEKSRFLGQTPPSE